MQNYRSIVAALVCVSVVFVVARVTPLSPVASALLVPAALAVVVLPRRALPAAARHVGHVTGVGWRRWAVAVVAVVAVLQITHVLWSPRVFVQCSVYPPRNCLTGYGLGSFLFVFGAAAATLAAGQAGRYWRVRRAVVRPLGDVSTGPGAIYGRAVAFGDTVETPATGTEAVWYRYAAYERRSLGSGGRDGWIPVETGGDATLFAVSNGMDRTFVDPDASFPAPDLTSAGVESTTVAVDDGRSGATGAPERRYREWYVAPDDVVSVAGEGIDAPISEYPDRSVIAPGEDGGVLLSGRKPEDVSTSLATRVFGWGIAGALCLAASAVLMHPSLP